MIGDRLAVASRIAAAVLGSLFVAVSGSGLIALASEDAPSLGVALALVLAVPIWVSGMCLGFLARSHLRAWAGYLGVGAALTLAALVLAR